MHKTFVLALSAVVLATGAADARPNTTASCNKKYSACIDRCAARYGMEGKNFSLAAIACVRRTCDRQLMNCLNSRTGSSSRPGEGNAQTPMDPPKGTGGHTPPLGGNQAEP